MKLRAFKPLRDTGASWAEIARAAGCDWRTAKKYLEQDTSQPPTYGPRRSPGRVIDPYTDVIDAWLRADPHLKASVIHERLAADPYGFAGHYQRVKVYVRQRRPQILAELGQDEQHGGFHARFATTPGAQAQVDSVTPTRMPVPPHRPTTPRHLVTSRRGRGRRWRSPDARWPITTWSATSVQAVVCDG